MTNQLLKYILVAESGYCALVNGTGRTLKDLQTLVDGLVDFVQTDPDCIGFHDCDAVINDEGLYRSDFGINLVGSYLTGRQLVGPVVLVKTTQHGNTVGLSQSDLQRLVKDGLAIDDNDGNGWSVDEAAYFFGSVGADA